MRDKNSPSTLIHYAPHHDVFFSINTYIWYSENSLNVKSCVMKIHDYNTKYIFIISHIQPLNKSFNDFKVKVAPVSITLTATRMMDIQIYIFIYCVLAKILVCSLKELQSGI